MNHKVDPCTSPLTNLYTGRKIRGNDEKVFTTTNKYDDNSSRKRYRRNNNDNTPVNLNATEDVLETPDIYGEVTHEDDSVLYPVDEVSENESVIENLNFDDITGVNIDTIERKEETRVEDDIELDLSVLKDWDI